VWARTYNLWIRSCTTAPLFQYDKNTKKEKIAERKWPWDVSCILYINLWNFLWIKPLIDSFGKLPCIFFELFPKLPEKIGPVNISKTTMNCFQNYLKKLGLSIFPKLPWIVSKTTLKFWSPQYFQVVLEIFPSSFQNFSCIENAFGDSADFLMSNPIAVI
jgi:hypothetical protein